MSFIDVLEVRRIRIGFGIKHRLCHSAISEYDQRVIVQRENILRLLAPIRGKSPRIHALL
jgi:hypothetical protein